jgi:hypothetical protein
MAKAPLAKGWLRTVSVTACLFVLSGLIVGNLPGQGKKPPAKEKEPAVKEAIVDALPPSGVEQILFTNQSLAKAWKENKIVPSARASDYEFIRRACLDIIGRIAKVKEIEQFFRDPERERRHRLIERLLASPEYSSNWANIWTVLLLTRRGVGKVYQEQMHTWLTDKLSSNEAAWDKIVTELLTATGDTNQNGAVNYVLAHMGERIPQEQDANGAWDMVPVTSRTTRLFLGLRTQCVQCHDHPFSGEWAQKHFWGINAFFRQVDAPRGRPLMMAKKQKGLATQQFALVDRGELNVKGIVPFERRSGLLLYTDPVFLDGTKMNAVIKGNMTRRQALAAFIIKSPWFSKAYVNRLWAHFFGRSFTKDAEDDFGEANPVSNPELLDRLADDWANKYNHNPKDVIRWICNSRAYGLTSVANKTNEKPDDELLFSRMLLKAMTPEQLFDSLMTATDAKAGQARDSRLKLRQAWLDRLVLNFGDDEGRETSFNGTVIQALLLMNGQDINAAIMDKENGTVAAVLSKRAYSVNGAPKAMTDLYLAALNRRPTAQEFSKFLAPAMIRLPRVPAARQHGEAFWTGYYQDMFWAILNSGEFILNH